jgi:hypothetical protein
MLDVDLDRLQTDLACSRWLPRRSRRIQKDPEGSRRIQKDRLDDHRDDQGASDRKSDGKASRSLGPFQTDWPMDHRRRLVAN